MRYASLKCVVRVSRSTIHQTRQNGFIAGYAYIKLLFFLSLDGWVTMQLFFKTKKKNYDSKKITVIVNIQG